MMKCFMRLANKRSQLRLQLEKTFKTNKHDEEVNVRSAVVGRIRAYLIYCGDPIVAVDNDKGNSGKNVILASQFAPY